MKKIVSICLLLVLLGMLALPASAVSAKAAYTSGSSFQVGGTASIDTVATRQNVMSDSGVTSDLYNAALEGNMSYHWVSSNGGTPKDGESVTWTQADVGKEFYCQVGFYSDKDCVWYLDHIISEPVIIQGAEAAKLSPNGGTYYLTVGKPFQLKISCNVPVQEIGYFMTSMPNGLSINKDGLITGTPTKEGFWYVTIAAWKGEDDVAADAGFEFYVSKEEAKEVYPGEALAKDPTVKNIGANPCLVRVKVEWPDEEKVAGDWNYRNEGYQVGQVNEGWYAAEDGYIYYLKALAAGDTTEKPAFTSVVVPTTLTNGDGETEYDIMVYAEAVQAQGVFASYSQVEEIDVATELETVQDFFAKAFADAQ